MYIYSTWALVDDAIRVSFFHYIKLTYLLQTGQTGPLKKCTFEKPGVYGVCIYTHAR